MINERKSQQTEACLELRVLSHSMDEDTFDTISQQLSAIGQGQEEDVKTGKSYYIAWFTVAEDRKKQRAQIAASVMLAGAITQDIIIKILDDSWETAWQKDWTAQAVGASLCVRPSFCEALPDRKIDIVLDPGMAFGTGTHPTTRLCLEAMEQVCKTNVPITMLDMGAGSGLLAIAGLKFGINSALAIDYDEESVLACRSNAVINNVTFEALLDDTPPTATKFELVVANILAGPLLKMAQQLADCTKQHLILSGLLKSQRESIQSAYEAHGLTLEQQWSMEEQGDDWIALLFQRENV